MIRMDEDTLTTDRYVVTGFVSINKPTFITNQHVKRRIIKFQASTTFSSVVWFERSALTRSVSRNYLGLLDILSYVGGTYPCLVGVFFMGMFGSYFEMTLAYTSGVGSQTARFCPFPQADETQGACTDRTKP